MTQTQNMLTDEEIKAITQQLQERLASYNQAEPKNLQNRIEFLNKLTSLVIISPERRFSWEEVRNYYPQGYFAAVRKLQTEINPQLKPSIVQIKMEFRKKLMPYKDKAFATMQEIQDALKDLMAPVKISNDLSISYEQCIPHFAAALPSGYTSLIKNVKQKEEELKRVQEQEELARKAMEQEKARALEETLLPLFQARLTACEASNTLADYKRALAVLESPIQVGDNQYSLENYLLPIVAQDSAVRTNYCQFVQKLKENITILDKQEPQLQVIFDELTSQLNAINKEKHLNAYVTGQALIGRLDAAKKEYVKNYSPQAKADFIAACHYAFEDSKDFLQDAIPMDSLENIMKRIINAVRTCFGYSAFFKSQPIQASEATEQQIKACLSL